MLERREAADNEIREYMKTHFIGKDVEWTKYGPYPGRRAKIRDAFPELKYNHGQKSSVEIEVSVYTYRADGNGFVEYPKGGRRYRDFDFNFRFIK